jgi:hypothetical protein
MILSREIAAKLKVVAGFESSQFTPKMYRSVVALDSVVFYKYSSLLIYRTETTLQ